MYVVNFMVSQCLRGTGGTTVTELMLPLLQPVPHLY
jgi:hypothetical protein